MDDFIKAYLSENYTFKLSTFSSFMLYDKVGKQDMHIRDFMVTIQTIFGVSDDEFQEIWEEWVDKEIEDLHTKIDAYRKANGEYSKTVFEVNEILLSGLQ